MHSHLTRDDQVRPGLLQISHPMSVTVVALRFTLRRPVNPFFKCTKPASVIAVCVRDKSVGSPMPTNQSLTRRSLQRQIDDSFVTE